MWRKWPLEPLQVAVTVRVEAEMEAMRGENAALREELARLQEAYNRVEFRYRCETIVNAELVDLCRAEGVKFRPSLLGRPFDREEERA